MRPGRLTVIRARTSINARPECTSALALNRPLRGLPLTCRPTFSRSMRSSPMWISNPGRIGPFFKLGLSVGSRISVTCCAVTLLMLSL